MYCNQYIFEILWIATHPLDKIIRSWTCHWGQGDSEDDHQAKGHGPIPVFQIGPIQVRYLPKFGIFFDIDIDIDTEIVMSS